MTPILLSFIIPARNSSATIEKCLQSLAGQDFDRQQIEIIVADNLSTDETPAIAKRFTPKAISTTARTIAGVKNDGAAIAKGQFLAFIDSDCEIRADWIKSALEIFTAAPEIAAVGGYASVSPGPGLITDMLKSAGRQRLKSFYCDWHLRAFAVRSEIFIKTGGFDSGLETCEDVDLGYNLCRFGKLLADERFNTIHYGDPQSIKGLLLKEFWQAKDGLIILKKYPLKLKEYKHLSFQLWFWFFLLAVFFNLPLNNFPGIVCLLLFLAPPLVVSFTRLRQENGTRVNTAGILYALIYYVTHSLVLPVGVLRLFRYCWR